MPAKDWRFHMSRYLVSACKEEGPMFSDVFDIFYVENKGCCFQGPNLLKKYLLLGKYCTYTGPSFCFGQTIFHK